MAITVIGLDIAKNVFQVHGVDEAGRPVLRRRLRRSEVTEFFERIPRSWLASRPAIPRTIGAANWRSWATR
jgi:transposase